MHIEVRTFNRGRADEKRGLVLLSENEEESKMVDYALGDKIPVVIKGKVDLADGYGQHYIYLERDTEK